MKRNNFFLILGGGFLFLSLFFLRKRVSKTILDSHILYRISQYDFNIRRASSIYEVPRNLIIAIIYVESSGIYDALGTRGEYGLMQIQCATARDMGHIGECSQLISPAVNIEYGTKYLRWQHNRYGNWEKAISAYNAGHYTQRNIDYVRKVQEIWKALE